MMNTLIIGTGLIGGSFAYKLQALKITKQIYGIEKTATCLQLALKLKIIDKAYEVKTDKSKIDLIVLAVPVNVVLKMLPKFLDDILPHQIIMDVSSTKYEISKLVDKHKNRKNFVSTHPMWGTEYSGPLAAIKNRAFENRVCVICDEKKSDKEKLNTIKNIYRLFKMELCYMNSKEHDTHTAYISHISHITSFALANTVLKKEKQVDKIFQLAGGGFKSTVRLAKSSPDMWTPVFQQNKKNILNVLTENIKQLNLFKKYLERNEFKKIYQYILHANKIKKIVDVKLDDIK